MSIKLCFTLYLTQFCIFSGCSFKTNFLTDTKSHVYPRRDLGPGHQEIQEPKEQGATHLRIQRGRNVFIIQKNCIQPFLQLADLQWMYYWQKAVVC